MIERLNKAAALVGGIGVLVVTLLVSYDVLMRYFFDAPQLFVDELAGFLQVLIIFGGLAYTFQTGGHVRVDLLTAMIRPERRARLRVVSLVLGLVLILTVAWVTLQSMFTAIDYGRVSAVMLYPLWLPMLFIPLGLGLLALALLVALRRQISVLRGPKHQRDEIALNADSQ